MKKLLKGIVDFRNNQTEASRRHFAQLALGQKPDAMLITCSDSRVAPNVFASTNPGDVFVVRNIGNLVPHAKTASPVAGNSVVAALEFSTNYLPVQDIIICGHSECGAMQALLHEKDFEKHAGLSAWLKHGHPALARLQGQSLPNGLSEPYNQLSLFNVLQQMDHVRSYPHIAEKIDTGKLRVHGWFFNIGLSEVSAFVDEKKGFVPINEDYVKTYFQS